MKNNHSRWLLINFFLIITILGSLFFVQSGQARSVGKERPQIALRHYWSNEGPLTYGLDFNLVLKLKNDSSATAMRVQVSFSSTDISPRKTGGVIVVGNLNGFAATTISQPMTVIGYLIGRKNATAEMNMVYYDTEGIAYTEKFTLLIPAGENTVRYKSPTPTPFKHSQLVITDYSTSQENLQPGMAFTLNMTVKNVGNIAARSATMIVGGGSTVSGGSGTPGPGGGVSGAGGEFTNFAPVGTSNVQSLGDLAVGGTLEASQKLIVNVSTNPGAYPMKVTFSYVDEAGNVVNDEQVITLLVYSLPTVDVSFYQPVTGLMSGQPNLLPLQVVNLGKRAAVLGSLTVETTGGTLENNSGLVGSLEPGGYFTIDTMVYPESAGPLEVNVTINYTDDFNNARTITKTLKLDVMEGAPPIDGPTDPNMPGGGGEGMGPVDGGGEGMPTPPAEESWLDQAWRFVLGLFGLDSGTPNNNNNNMEPTPPAEVPIPSGGGKGG